MTELTVGLPLYKAKNTAWIALQSLVNQKGVDFDWELIVIEEQTEDKFGYDRIAAVKDLTCNIFYEDIYDWIPLSEKWIMMGKMAASSSKAFLLCGNDDYAPPYWLKHSYDLITKYGADWCHNLMGYYYDLIDKRLVKFDGTIYSQALRNMNPLLFKALRTEHMKEFKIPTRPEKLVDTWLMTNMNMVKNYPNIIINNSPDVLNGVCTYGANLIDHNYLTGGSRHSEIRNNEHPFYETDKKIKDILPEHVVKRLGKVPTRKEGDVTESIQEVAK